jgi:transposase
MDSLPTNALVRDPRAAALLVDSRRNRFLWPFLGRASGVGDAAAALGVGKSLVSYWVGRLQKVGLLRPVSGGGRKQLYRAPADGFVVALQDVPLESVDAILGAQLDPFYARLKRALLRAAHRYAQDWRFSLRRVPLGVAEELAPREGTLVEAQIVNMRAALHLSAGEAAALRVELRGLIDRYAALTRPEEPQRQRVLVWAAAVEDVPS